MYCCSYARAEVKVHLKLSMCCALLRGTQTEKATNFWPDPEWNFVVVITICCGCASRLSYLSLIPLSCSLSLSLPPSSLSLSLCPACALYRFVFPPKVWQTKRVAASATVRVEQAAVYLCMRMCVCWCVCVCWHACCLKCGISSAGFPCVLRCPLVSAAISVSARLVTAFCG